MRRMGMVLAACALAACGAGEGGDSADARAADAPPPAAAGAGSAPDRSVSAPADTGAFAFRLHETQPGVVDSITVARAGRDVQTLRPPENHVLPEMGIERISRIDLDFDGHADLALLAEVGNANSRSAYWRLDPGTGRFADAGAHETLAVDSAARELTSMNRGGHGGRLWSAARWKWADGALAPVRQEEQDWAEDAQRYVRVVRERRGGAMVEVARDTLQDAAVRAGPSWMEP